MQAMKDWHKSHPHIFIKSPRNHAGRDSYGKELSTAPYIFVGRYLLERAGLTESDCIGIFGETSFREASAAAIRNRHHGAFSPVIHPTLSLIDQAQSCFSLLSPVENACDQCKTCPILALCEKSHGLVLVRLKEATGSVDPLKEKQLKQQRDRTSLCRKKKRMASSGPASVNPGEGLE